VGEPFANQLLGGQLTGGSTSVADAWVKLRKVGAQARQMLVSAACTQWGIDPEGCRTENGEVISPQGKRLAFGELAEAAGKLPVPQEVALKPASDFTVIGKRTARLDTPSKVDGSAGFGVDVRLDGMLYGALAQCPTLGGRLRSVDDAAARAMPGVKAVVKTAAGGVVVVADSWWRARKARDALVIEWDAGPNAALDSATISQRLRKASARPGAVARNDGDALKALGRGKVLRADYELPMLAHATLEPQNCTASVTADGCDLHVPTQFQPSAQAAAAAAAGLKPEQVRLHPCGC
jgi:isoquinoline 1-oxidoreductase subunit beta